MKTKRLVQGIGINDVDYVVRVRETVAILDGKQIQKLLWECPYYNRWCDMLRRSYSKKKYPTYKESYVCKDWLRLSNFKAWMETQDWEGKQLDKDLLAPDNKVYSPETCIFVDKIVNGFITERRSNEGDYPAGVYYHKASSRFMARCSQLGGQEKFLGYFDNPDEAYNAWLSEKRNLARTLAAQQEDQRISDALINRYFKYYKMK